MRTRRVSTVGTVILAVMTGVSASAVAQDEQSAPGDLDYVLVTGTEEGLSCDEGLCTATDVMSDPRVSGDMELTYVLACSEVMTCSMDGELRLTNAGGAWDGEYVGWIAAGGVHEVMFWMSGSEGYEGWSYLAYLNGFDDGDSADIRGLLYRGDLPPSVAPAGAVLSSE